MFSKHRIALVAVLGGVLALAGCSFSFGDSAEDDVEFNDALITASDEADNITFGFYDLFDAMTQDNQDETEAGLAEAIAGVKAEIKKMEDLEVPDGADAFYDAVLDAAKYELEVLEGAFTDVVTSFYDETVTAEDFEVLYSGAFETFQEKYDEYLQVILDEQETYADDAGFDLIEQE
jgi:hypothetical protein